MNPDRLKDWIESRSGLSTAERFLREKTVPRHRYSFWYYTGGVILLFLSVQIVTGFLLVFYYRPTLGEAHASVERLVNEVPLGWIVRSVHAWSASLMIASLFVHLFGQWVTRAYRGPREFTWMSGVLLLLLALGFGFTGYLLPWDALSLSATKVGTDIPRSVPLAGDWIARFLRGGEDVSGDTLGRFFALHVCILPLLLSGLLGLHVVLIQKHGMSVPAGVEKRGDLPFWPNFLYREMRLWLVLLGLLVTAAACFPPGLGKAADLMAPAPEGIRPEWYFLFLYQTLKLFPPRLLFVDGDTVAVLGMAVGMGLLFFLPLVDAKPGGKGGKVAVASAWSFLVYAVLMTVWSLLS